VFVPERIEEDDVGRAEQPAARELPTEGGWAIALRRNLDHDVGYDWRLAFALVIGKRRPAIVGDPGGVRCDQ